MIVSRVSTLVVAAMCLWFAPAMAQDAPIRLAPPTEEGRPAAENAGEEVSEESAPGNNAILDYQGSDERPALRTVPGWIGGGEAVEVGVLTPDGRQAERPSRLGLLSAGHGGFHEDIWQGTPRLRALNLLTRLPVEKLEGEAADLAFRLLVTDALEPGGPGADRSMLALRAERLYAAGRLEQARGLLDLLPRQEAAGEEVQRLRADIELLSTEPLTVCRGVPSQRLNSDTPYWMMLRAYCYVLADAPEAARLTADLLQEEGEHAPLFYALIDHMTGYTGADIGELAARALTPRDVAMLRTAGITIPARAYEEAPLPVARALARTEPAPDAREAWFAAVERVAAAGAISRADFRSLARNAPGRGELLARTISANGDAEILTLLQQLARESGEAGRAPLYLRMAPYAVSPSPALASVGEAAARAAILDDSHATAASWLGAFSGYDDPADGQSDPRVRALSALMAVAGARTASFNDGEALRWLDMADRGIVSRGRVELELALLAALGHRLPQIVVDRLDLTREQSPDERIAAELLAEAANRGHVAETLALSLIALDGPAHAAADRLVPVVAALHRVGLGAEARRLAVEALAAHALTE
jgi:hypothetical protein